MAYGTAGVGTDVVITGVVSGTARVTTGTTGVVVDTGTAGVASVVVFVAAGVAVFVAGTAGVASKTFGTVVVTAGTAGVKVKVPSVVVGVGVGVGVGGTVVVVGVVLSTDFGGCASAVPEGAGGLTATLAASTLLGWSVDVGATTLAVVATLFPCGIVVNTTVCSPEAN